MKRREFICAAIGAAAIASGKGTASAMTKAEVMTVYKDPSCGCCNLWSQAIKAAGFSVRLVDTADVAAVKQRLGVPKAVQGCHTATIGAYYIEGHVPLAAVEELLMDPHDISGYAVPGMPSGSLGMGVDPKATYNVYAISKTGDIEVVLEIKPLE